MCRPLSVLPSVLLQGKVLSMISCLRSYVNIPEAIFCFYHVQTTKMYVDDKIQLIIFHYLISIQFRSLCKTNVLMLIPEWNHDLVFIIIFRGQFFVN